MLGKGKGDWDLGGGGAVLLHFFLQSHVESCALSCTATKSLKVSDFSVEVCAVTYFVFIRTLIILWSGNHNGTYILPRSPTSDA